MILAINILNSYVFISNLGSCASFQFAYKMYSIYKNMQYKQHTWNTPVRNRPIMGFEP